MPLQNQLEMSGGTAEDRLHQSGPGNGTIKSQVPNSSDGAATAEEGRTMRLQVIQPSVWRRRSQLEKGLLLALLLLFILCIILFIVALTLPSSESSQGSICLSHHCIQTASSLLAAMDLTADPCTDFFQFACGTWNKKHVIPEDKSSISTFEVLTDQQLIILKGLLEEKETPEDTQATLKAKILYNSCMERESIGRIGDAPIKQMMSDLGGWPVIEPGWNPAGWILEEKLAKMKRTYNAAVFVEAWVGPDDKNSSLNILLLDQPLLGMPTKDYYVEQDSDVYKVAYHQLMVNVAVLLGAKRYTAEQHMQEVLDLEVELAEATVPDENRHDTGAIYEKMTVRDLQKTVPELNWMNYMNLIVSPIKITEKEELVSYSMSYMKKLGRILVKQDKRVIMNYAIWRIVLDLLPQMGEYYREAILKFHKVIFGIAATPIHWQQCVQYVNGKMGMAVGALFIRDNFQKESKEVALEMIHNIRKAFNELLVDIAWMDDETREVARIKANSMNERIGYPDFLKEEDKLNKEYDGLNIEESKFLKNVFAIELFEVEKNMKKLRVPTDKDKWDTSPAEVNAFYSPNRNDIVFPAAILQPLFYSSTFPKSLNYGGIGVVIGHEITHGFDDKGRQFDKDGNLKLWWNNATISAFRKRAQCVVDQYSAYKLEQVDMHINGKNTQGENIADNGGLKQAFRAYQKWVHDNGEEPLLPGLNLTHNQLFFLNYAQIWCGSMRDQDAVNKIRSSVHSPGPVRVMGPLSNSHEFANAYQCKAGSRMNPDKKCSVW